MRSQVINDTKFCKNCESEIIQEEEITIDLLNTCPNCGEEVEGKMKFCTNCGSKLIEEKVETKKTKFCTNCGFEMDGNISFCSKCGTSARGQLTHNNDQLAVKSNKSQYWP